MNPLLTLALILFSAGATAAPRRALVLGSGGSAGVGWEMGILRGLVDAGLDPLKVDFILGTSAGSSVSAQITSGRDWDTLFADQLVPVDPATELDPGVNWSTAAAALTNVVRTAPSEAQARRLVGAMAVGAHTVTEAARRSAIASRLQIHSWPALAIGIVAVDTATGLHRLFDRASGVSIVDAVTASCAVPLMWPPATIDGSRYMDGGARTYENADLLVGYDAILILSTRTPGKPALIGGGMDKQIAPLTAAGAQVVLIQPDPISAQAMGPDFLDPHVRAPSARAGRRQGLLEAARAATIWQ